MEANEVVSRPGASPTVVTSCPERSTSRAQSDFVSPRKRRRDSVMAVKSSCVNDQLAVPAVIFLRSQRGFEVPEHPGSALAENAAGLPGDVFAKQLCGGDGRAGAQISERSDAEKRIAGEQIAPAVALHSAPHQRTSRHAAEESHGDCASALSTAHDIALRAVKAWAMVTPSAYSRSPPTGSPRAILEIVSG